MILHFLQVYLGTIIDSIFWYTVPVVKIDWDFSICFVKNMPEIAAKGAVGGIGWSWTIDFVLAASFVFVYLFFHILTLDSAYCTVGQVWIQICYNGKI